MGGKQFDPYYDEEISAVSDPTCIQDVDDPWMVS